MSSHLDPDEIRRVKAPPPANARSGNSPQWLRRLTKCVPLVELAGETTEALPPINILHVSHHSRNSLTPFNLRLD